MGPQYVHLSCNELQIRKIRAGGKLVGNGVGCFEEREDVKGLGNQGRDVSSFE